MSEPSQWLTRISQATWTLLLAGLAVYVAGQIFKHLLPALLIIGGLLAIYRLLVRGWQRGGW